MHRRSGSAASTGVQVAAHIPLPWTKSTGSPAPHSSTPIDPAGSASRSDRRSTASP